MDRERNLGILTKILLAVSIIGAINWGLIGFFNWNLVNAVFGGQTALDMSGFSRFLYALVGLCGLVAAFFLPRLRETAPMERRTTATTPVRP